MHQEIVSRGYQVVTQAQIHTHQDAHARWTTVLHRMAITGTPSKGGTTMKKYTEYLSEQYTPLTRDELTKYEEVAAVASFSTSTGTVNMQTFSRALLDEIMFLRSQMAVAYEYIGRRAPNPAPKRYRKVMHHATRIRTEEREASQ